MDPFYVNVTSPHLLRKHALLLRKEKLPLKTKLPMCTRSVRLYRWSLVSLQSSVSSWTGTRPWASAHQLIGTLGIGNVAVMTREFPSVFVLAPNSQR